MNLLLYPSAWIVVVMIFWIAPTAATAEQVAENCTEKFVQQIKPEMSWEGQELREISQNSSSFEELFIDRMQKALQKYSPPGTDYQTAISFAKQADALHSTLTEKEWKNLVTLWAQYVLEVARFVEATAPGDYCGPTEQFQSMASDVKLFFSGPAACASALVHPKSVFDGMACMPQIQLLSLVGGPVFLGTDAVTLVPSTMLKYLNVVSGRNRRHALSMTTALNKFANAVTNVENKYATAQKAE
jgi:hypothetical protein